MPWAEQLQQQPVRRLDEVLCRACVDGHHELCMEFRLRHDPTNGNCLWGRNRNVRRCRCPETSTSRACPCAHQRRA